MQLLRKDDDKPLTKYQNVKETDQIQQSMKMENFSRAEKYN